MNPWHGVELGDHLEQHFRCVMEIPKGAKVKYELDKKTGLLWLDRVLHSAVHCYKVLENKLVDIDQIRGRVDAENVIRDAARLYRARIFPTLGKPGSGPRTAS